jgi:hypothetical protein
MSPTLDHLLTRQATLLRRTPTGPEDELGDPTWEIVAEPIACELQPAGSSEDHGDNVQSSSWRVFLPASCADVAGWDALELDGETYELAGDPSPLWHPRLQTVDHVEAIVTRVR